MTEKAKFLEFVGDVWLRGRAVVAYKEHDGMIRLQAETCGGKIISRIKRVTKEEFRTLKAEWCTGVQYQDARIAERSLKFMGIEVE